MGDAFGFFQGKISERFGSCMLVINLFIEITFPAVVVLIVHPSPCESFFALLFLNLFQTELIIKDDQRLP